MANNLLDKSSIILTPTAYNNGKALCVKPSDGSGDFDFSRNSAATRVNAQGLVENVQILSSNLVQNPSFSEEGVQEVSNGSFTNGSTDWNFIGEAELTEQGARIYSSDGSVSQINQPNVMVIGKQYKLTFDVIATNGANLSNADGSNIYDTSTAGSKVFYITAQYSTLYLKRLGGITDVTIDNISVKEVGMDWVLGTGWNIGEDKVVADNVSSNTIQNLSSIDANKSYNISFNISDYLGGQFFITFGGNDNTINFTANGSYSVYINPTNTVNNIFYLRGNGFTGSVTNISVIEISTDTNLPRINYENFSYQDALGSEEVVNGTFDDGTNNWSSLYNATISVVDSQLEITGAANGGGRCSQGITTTIGASYLLKATITNVNSNGITIKISQNSNLDGAYFNSATNTTTNPVEVTHTFIATSTTTYIGTNQAGSAYSAAFLDNVSVKEYLGQEVVPNSGCGSWLFESQSTNLITYSEDFSNAYWTGGLTNATITASTNVNPSGENGTYLVENVTGSRLASITSVTSGLSYGGSIYVRNVSGSGGITLSDVNGTITSFTATDKWQRFSVTEVANSTTGRFYLFVTTQGDIIEIWGAQLEQQSYATSYIPTSGSTVTRNQDLCTNGGSLATINSTSGTLYFEGSALSDDGTNRIISISDGTNGNRVQIYYSIASNSLFGIVFGGGVLSCSLNTTLANATDFIKVAFKYKENDFALWVNGVEVATDTSGNTPIGLDRLNFSLGSGILNFFGKTKCLAVFPYLSDQELTELTTI